MELPIIVLTAVILIVFTLSVIEYIRVKDQIEEEKQMAKEIELDYRVVKRKHNEIYILYNTQEVNTAIAMARYNPPNGTDHLNHISVSCLCDKGARVRVCDDTVITAEYEGTIIRMKKINE